MRNTFVVSGAGSGIGAAIAQAIASDGNRVLLLGRRRVPLEEVGETLPGDGHLIATADVCDPKQLRTALELLGDDGLAGVIANAGIGGSNVYGNNDRWGQILDTNLTGTYQLVNEALPHLRRTSEFRHVVVVSSILARLGVPGYSAYCASKAGLLGLVRSWATEWAAEKILVNAICPGWVDTDMAHQGMKGIASATGASIEEAHEGEMKRVPLGKMSNPGEIAQLVGFLIAGQQTSITGQTLDINGGALMP